MKKIDVRIYALINPITQKVFYIGATKQSVKQRLKGHINDLLISGNKKQEEINSILSAGHEPEILQLDEVPFEQASFFEEFYIQLFSSYGFDLYQNRRSTHTNVYIDRVGRMFIEVNNIRKNIDLTSECIKILTKDAVDNETVFKHHVENILEKKAEELKTKKK